MSEVEELRHLGNAVVIAWERLGQCEDEFAPDYDPPACNEWRENLDNAILSLSAAITDHALDREDRATGSGEPTTGGRDEQP